MENITFFSEDIDFVLSQQEQISNWLNTVSDQYGQEIGFINYIYCSDNYLLNINKEYLQHDYYTDIITFDQRDFDDEPIEADIFISIDRVRDNASASQSTFQKELHRVMVHGLLHLLDQDDKTPEQKEEMRKSEDACLSLLPI